LGAAIGAALVRLGRGKSSLTFRRQLNLDALTYKNLPLNSVAGVLVADFAEVVRTEGYGGVVLLIDEVGKFIEHAALYPEGTVEPRRRCSLTLARSQRWLPTP
jgi:hypothetical protein